MSAKTLNRRPEPTWFNIGCAGHTLAKLHLTRNTIASQGAAYVNLHAARQAALKLLTADYTGDGTPFTVAGQSLVWQGGEMVYLAGPASLEARWSESGASCLDVPRMAHPTTKAGAIAFPDIEAAIADHCKATGCVRPPRCRDADLANLDGALVMSANL